MCRFFPIDRLPSSSEGNNFYKARNPKRKGKGLQNLIWWFNSTPRLHPFFDPKSMKTKTHPGPTTPFYKSRGKWTFYVFPNGVGEEAGDYPDEETARAASWKTHCVWQANGCKY